MRGSCSRRFGEIGHTSYGGATLGIAYLMLAVAPAWWVTPLAVTTPTGRLVSLGLAAARSHANTKDAAVS
jgi:hypothetical protein